MEWYNLLALSLSALALMGSCFTYFVHDKKLKKQQTRLNDLQIKKLQREIKDIDSAQLRVKLINVTQVGHDTRYNGTISLVNYGKAEAMNVEVYAHINDMRSHYNEKHRVIESLLPGEYYEIPIEWSFMCANSIDVFLKWKEVSGKESTYSYSLRPHN